jgi:hypothetical protein
MLSWFFHSRIHTDIDTTEACKTVPHSCEDSWQSRLSRVKQLNIKHEGHGKLQYDIFSDVKKAFEVKLSLLHTVISKFTSFKTAVECSNPKDYLQTPKCKSFDIIQNPQDYFLVPEDSLKKVHGIQMLKITLALGVDQFSMQTKIEIFELQILTL